VHHTLDESSIFEAITGLMKRCRGGYTAVALINGFGIIAFRDPNGIRPLVYGMRKNQYGNDYAVASESVAIDTLEFELQRE
jgi:amidophosphoribosyltransferase